MGALWRPTGPHSGVPFGQRSVRSPAADGKTLMKWSATFDAVNIDEKAVSDALARAQTALEEAKSKGADLGGEEVAAVMAMIQRSTAQLHLKRKRHTV